MTKETRDNSAKVKARLIRDKRGSKDQINSGSSKKSRSAVNKVTRPTINKVTATGSGRALSFQSI